MTFRIPLIGLIMALSFSVHVRAQDPDLSLALPKDMIANGFAKHLLPRFGFKTRIRILPTDDRSGSDIAVTMDQGDPVFQSDGGTFHLLTLTDDTSKLTKIAKFRAWLESQPGQDALTGFQPDGVAIYWPVAKEAPAETVEMLEGDSDAGAKLALVHCGRCHVVDHRNPFGGIGSTPSFSALRGRIGWADLFLAFWSANPHPSFTQVSGVTEPFDPARPPHIAPIELSLEDIDAITAYVGTIEPKNLGAQVKSN